MSPGQTSDYDESETPKSGSPVQGTNNIKISIYIIIKKSLHGTTATRLVIQRRGRIVTDYENQQKVA